MEIILNDKTDNEIALGIIKKESNILLSIFNIKNGGYELITAIELDSTKLWEALNYILHE